MSSAPQPADARWQLLKTIFQTAGSLSPGEQDQYLDAACAGDQTLRAEAKELLNADREQRNQQTVPANSLIDSLVVGPRSLKGRRIGAYEILHEIGRGGMSTVYAAARVDQQFHKLVAIKIVRFGLHFEELVRRFQHERELLAGLEHPNIARLLDAGAIEENIPYLVMEYVEGVPIDRYVKTNNLSIAERIAIFRSVCSAVQYAHQNLVVHRDLKPANILVTSEGVAKLLDFGIAKLLRADLYGHDVDLTIPSAQPLTPQYASPEQIRGETVTTATDIYSLGVLLYILLTGKHPFYAQLSTPATLTRAILETEPSKPSSAVAEEKENRPEPSLDRLRRQLRGDLDTIVLTALRKEPRRRYQSAERLSDDLDRYLKGLPVAARHDTTFYRTSKFVHRHTAGVVATVLAILALIATSALAVRSASVARQQRATAERRFQDGRQFARFVLFQLDDAMRSGITPARKLTIDKALTYLNGLERESGGDPSLQLDLVEGYAKVGDLQGSFLGPNLGDSTAARNSYEHALAIADRLAASSSYPAAMRSQILRDRAMVYTKLGNLLSLSGQRKQALARYTAAKTALEPIAPSNPQAYRDLLEVLDHIGWTQLGMGNPQEALASYLQYLKLARRFTDQPGNESMPDTRRNVAHGLERIAYVRARTGNVKQGLQELEQALSVYRELAAANPERADAQRDVAMTQLEIGDIGAPRDSIPDLKEALQITERLAAADPQNTQYSRDRFVILGRLAYALSKSGHLAEAKAVTDKAARLLTNVQVQDASEYDLMLYASVLLTKPVDPNKAERALQFARAATERSNGKDPFVLQILAEAQNASGDSATAVVTAQNALALLPQQGTFDSRTALEQDLAEFRARAAREK